MFRKEEVEGKIVIEASGKALGKAKDVAFGLDGTVALIVQGSDDAEIQVTMDRVAGVGDYIVVRREKAEAPLVKRPAVPAMQQSPSPGPVAAANPAMPAPRTAAPMATPAAAPAAAVCRSCGAPLRAGAKFCTKCGTPA